MSLTLDDLLLDIVHAGNASFSDGVTFCPGEQTFPYLSHRERCFDHSLFFADGEQSLFSISGTSRSSMTVRLGCSETGTGMS